jgi:enoyl-CoA hydratase
VRLETMFSDLCGSVATIVLDRPHVLNCIDEQWLHDFNAIVDDLAADDRVRVVVVRGAGRAFCTGIDLRALAAGETAPHFFRDWECAIRKLETMPALVLAAIHSHCIGGGLQLALACDIRLARDDARFGITAVKEGIIPGMGTWRIARHAGTGRAKQLALIADVIDADTALQWGLVNEIVGAERFEQRIGELTDRMLAMAWTSTRLTKELIDVAHETPFDDFLERFCESQRLATNSPEHQQAMAERRARDAARAHAKS